MAAPLPPLAAIRVFEAAARLSSFTRAAEELGMTQAAVSYQIKVLEERVGGPLFVRLPRQVELTEAGRALLPKVSEAFRLLSEAYVSVQGGSGGQLNITTTQTFASNWLSRRLGIFQLENSGIAVRLDTSNRLVDFAREDVDVGIRVGTGEYPGLVSHYLFDGDFSPMLSPKLAESVGGIRKPADLLQLPLLGSDDYWWEKWFTAAGVPFSSSQVQPGARLGAQSYEATAAVAGQGVALLTRHLYREDIAEGRLVQPFETVGSDCDGYWLVYAEHRRNVPKIRAFRDWIIAQVKLAGLGDPAEPKIR